DEWKRAWVEGIEPAMSSVMKYRDVLNKTEGEELLNQLPSLLTELKASQWWVKSVAQTPGNEPARVTYLFEVEPVTQSLDSIIALIIKEAKLGGRLVQRGEIFQLSNAQRFFSVAQLLLEKIVFEGGLHLEKKFRDHLRWARTILDDRALQHVYHSPEQHRLFGLFQRESQAFEKLADDVITQRKSDKWNIAQYLMTTETVPLAKKAIEMATGLTSISSEIMSRHSSSAERAAKVALMVMIVLIVMMILAALFLSRGQALSLTKPVTALSVAAQEFSKGRFTKDIPVTSNDELGDLTRVFNSMRTSLHHAQEELRTANEYLEQRVGKRTEELRKSEEKYRTLFENASEAIVVAQDGVIKFVNPKGEELYGYSQEELASRSLTYFIHEEDREMVGERHEKRLRGEVLPGTYHFRIINKAGDIKWVELNVASFSWEDRPATLCFMTDITERLQAEEEQKKLEAQFQQAQKMEAMGTLAGGIAHDFNNLLMGIQGNASLMMLDFDSNHIHYEKLQAIEKMVKSGSSLTRQLLGYARKGRYEVTPINLNQLVMETSDTFGRTRKEITINREFMEDISSIEADHVQIEQVLLNLYVNAADAMPGGGDLMVKTMNITDKDMKGKLYNPRPGRYVQLNVTDTGIGMDKETSERIFDPFFTTKEMGRGTGLGLASAYGIIKAHGGYIDCDSKKGQGTTFDIYLPASEKEAIEEKKVYGEVLNGTETLLLVDDEAMIINVGEKMLKKMGYTVLSAGSGKEAIDIYEKNMRKIDMVILDMIMPGVSGGKTYDRMKEINPQIKVLLSSGYSIDGQATEKLERGCNGFIQKPFDMKELSYRLREILDKK
ncbi:MAG: PAS domain S-box protein, partial [Desulfatiglandales bacterium]